MSDNTKNPHKPHIPSSAAPEFTGNPKMDGALIKAIKTDERIR